MNKNINIIIIFFVLLIQSTLVSADSEESICEIISLKKEYTIPKYENIANKTERLKLDKGFIYADEFTNEGEVKNGLRVTWPNNDYIPSSENFYYGQFDL